MRSISFSSMDEKDWSNMTKNSVGGSESAILLGLGMSDPLNEYMSYHELWGIKSGLYTRTDSTNQFTIVGNELEDYVAQSWWRYWEDDFQTTLKNKMENKVIRECESLDVMYIHDAYNFITGRLDRVIEDPELGKGVLEIKNISQRKCNRYKNGIPPQYIVQIQHYLLVTGWKFAELVMWKRDICEVVVYRFYRNEKLIKTIEDAAINFWELVENTRKCIAEKVSYMDYEPAFEHTEIFKQFMVKRWQPELESTILGNSSLYDLCVLRDAERKRISESKKIILSCENEIRAAMHKDKDTHYELMEFEEHENAKVIWNKKSNGYDNFNIYIKK